MKSKTAIVWFRNDLRTSDHPAMTHAINHGYRVIPLFIWSPEEEGEWAPGAASQWWLHHSLKSLDESLQKLGSRLIVRRGSSLAVLSSMVRESGASAVFFSEQVEPILRKRDDEVRRELEATGVQVATFSPNLLLDPSKIFNQSNAPYQVFTSYWKRSLSQIELRPITKLNAPLIGPVKWPGSLQIENLNLLPSIRWYTTIEKTWQPGEDSAKSLISDFLKAKISSYDRGRDIPSQELTSRLSPHLHFGEITPNQILHALIKSFEKHGFHRNSWKIHRFVTEMGWREFSHYLLYHFPNTSNEPLRPEFKRFPWSDNADHLKAWQRGQTGYPLVDAGMRELWATGWMHNRVRMVVASFLVKHLRVHWLEGARWFWDTLVDADLAQNSLGWQWSAGCGADAAPYFRIFNPMLQAEKFDPEGEYIRKWVPELARLPKAYIFEPSKAPEKVIKHFGIELGKTYPKPIVDHPKARASALRAFDTLKTVKHDP